MNVLSVTLVMAGVSALIIVWLGFRVSQLRRRYKVSIGDGDNEAVRTRMRAHANFCEYTPLFLILLAVVELAAGSETWLWLVAALFVLGRMAHPFGLERPGANPLRAGAMIITWVVLLGLGACAVAIAYSELGRPAVTYAEARAST